MSDYNFLMESRLSPEQFQIINYLSRIAVSHGLNLYLVGGAVRDLTYGQQVIRDLDFAVEGSPQKFLQHLQSPPRGSEPAPARIAHQQPQPWLGSTEITFTNGVRAEIAMTRNEIYSKPGRRPEITPAGIFEDLRRRDFSVNAMAISLHPNSRGLLLDPTNGAADIERRELRALHSRSFQENPARIYRLLRLGTRLDFKPEERTRGWLESALESRLWERMDPDQQGRELRAILQEDNPSRVLKALAGRGLLAGLDRKLGALRMPYDHFARIRSVVQSIPGADAFLLNFHCLTAKLGSAQRNRLAAKTIGHAQTRRMALGLEGAARKLARVLGSSKAALPSQTYTLLSAQPLAMLAFLLANYRQTKIQARVKSFLFKYPLVRARMPRAELLTLGLEAGPKFEKIFDQLLLAQLDGMIKTHQQLLKEFRALAGIKEPAPKPVTPARPARAAVKVKAEKKKKGKR